MYKIIKNKVGSLDTVLNSVSNTSFVDKSEDNTDYQAYLEWLAEGNTPEPADE